MDELLKLQPGKGTIFRIYNKLCRATPVLSEDLKFTWEGELGGTILDNVWSSVLILVNSNSFCAWLSILQFKVVHRGYLSKSKLARIYPGLDPQCNRCRSDQSNLTHMFWSCPALTAFWEDILHTLNNITGLKLSPNPTLAVFGAVDENRRGVLSWWGGKILSRPLLPSGFLTSCCVSTSKRFIAQSKIKYLD